MLMWLGLYFSVSKPSANPFFTMWKHFRFYPTSGLHGHATSQKIFTFFGCCNNERPKWIFFEWFFRIMLIAAPRYLGDVWTTMEQNLYNFRLHRVNSHRNFLSLCLHKKENTSHAEERMHSSWTKTKWTQRNLYTFTATASSTSIGSCNHSKNERLRRRCGSVDCRKGRRCAAGAFHSFCFTRESVANKRWEFLIRNYLKAVSKSILFFTFHFLFFALVGPFFSMVTCPYECVSVWYLFDFILLHLASLLCSVQCQENK